MRANIFWSFVLAGTISVGAQQKAAPQWVTPSVSAPRLQYHTFESTAAKTKVSYFIYTPEVYDAAKERRFPVMYWLHGSGGGEAGLRPLTTYFNKAIHDGKIPPMLIVFPNGMASSMWCDSKDGTVPMETVVVKELVPHIDATFRTHATRAGRLIEGFSMGGYGAARLGFKYHELFGAVSIIAGGPLDLQLAGPRATGRPEERQRLFQSVYGGDLKYFQAQSPWVLAEQNADAVRSKTRVRHIVGDRDNTFELNRDFEAHLTQLKIPHTFTVLPGIGHNAQAVLKALGETNWVFYNSIFGATNHLSGAKQPAP